MSMGWYLIPRSSMASSRAPTTNRASCLSVWEAQRQKGRSGRRCRRREQAEVKHSERKLTSIGVGELGAAEEAQVTCPGPDRLRVSKTESGVEVIRLENLLTITTVVTAAIVSAVHPDLHEEKVQIIDC